MPLEGIALSVVSFFLFAGAASTKNCTEHCYHKSAPLEWGVTSWTAYTPLGFFAEAIQIHCAAGQGPSAHRSQFHTSPKSGVNSWREWASCEATVCAPDDEGHAGKEANETQNFDNSSHLTTKWDILCNIWQYLGTTDHQLPVGLFSGSDTIWYYLEITDHQPSTGSFFWS